MSVNPNYDVWEFNELINEDQLNGAARHELDFVMDGLGLTDAGGLLLEVAAGFAYVSGYEVALGAPDFLTLANGATNHVFLRFDRLADVSPATSVVGVAPEVVSNTTGTPPTDSIKLGEADTAAGVITAIRPADQRRKIHDAQLTTDIGGNHQQITELVVHKGTALPSSPEAGQLFFRTTDGALLKFDGAAWVELDAGTASGGVTAVNGEGTGLAVGEAVRVAPGSDGTVVRARADSEVNAFVVGLAEAAIAAAGSGRVVTGQGGVETAQFETGLTLAAGDEVYLSSAVAGALTNVQPTTTGEIVKVVGSLWDASAYVGTTAANSKASVLLQIEQGTIVV